jgi:hypothetical protein
MRLGAPPAGLLISHQKRRNAKRVFLSVVSQPKPHPAASAAANCIWHVLAVSASVDPEHLFQALEE